MPAGAQARNHLLLKFEMRLRRAVELRKWSDTVTGEIPFNANPASDLDMQTYLFYHFVQWRRHNFSAKFQSILLAACRKMKLDINVCLLPSSAETTIAGNC